MNRCLTHNQEYPQAGYCVYCGRPDDGLQAAPVVPRVPPVQPFTAGTYWTTPDPVKFYRTITGSKLTGEV